MKIEKFSLWFIICFDTTKQPRSFLIRLETTMSCHDNP